VGGRGNMVVGLGWGELGDMVVGGHGCLGIFDFWVGMVGRMEKRSIV